MREPQRRILSRDNAARLSNTADHGIKKSTTILPSTSNIFCESNIENF